MLSRRDCVLMCAETGCPRSRGRSRSCGRAARSRARRGSAPPRGPSPPKKSRSPEVYAAKRARDIACRPHCRAVVPTCPVGSRGEFAHGVAQRLRDSRRHHDGQAQSEPWRETFPYRFERLVRAAPSEGAQRDHHTRSGDDAGRQQVRRLQQANEPDRRVDLRRWDRFHTAIRRMRAREPIVMDAGARVARWLDRPRCVYGVLVATIPRSSLAVIRAMALVGAMGVTAPAVAQSAFRVYPSFEGDVAEAPLPPDYQVPGELVVGHLMFPDGRFGRVASGGTAARDGPTIIRRATARSSRCCAVSRARTCAQSSNP